MKKRENFQKKYWALLENKKKFPKKDQKKSKKVQKKSKKNSKKVQKKFKKSSKKVHFFNMEKSYNDLTIF